VLYKRLPLGKPSADNCICRFRLWQLHEEAACYRSDWFRISWSWQSVMRGNLCSCVLVASALLGSVAALGAEQFATADDARAMLDRAIAALKANKVAALAAFNDEKNKDFHDRDLYIFCFSLPDGNFTAYQSPLMLGTNVRELKLDKDAIGQRQQRKATSSRWTSISRSRDQNCPPPSNLWKHVSAIRPAA
jgi:hypothetical protein